MEPPTILSRLRRAGLSFVSRALRGRGATSRRVAIALVDALSSPTACAEIIRFADDARPDVILLRWRESTAADLAAAIVSYRAMASRGPRRGRQLVRSYVEPQAARGSASPGLRNRAAMMLTEVRRAPACRVGNYGRGRWATFDLRLKR